MWKWVKLYMAGSYKNPVGLIHTWAREVEEQHLVQCQGVLGSTRLSGPTEEHAQRSKEPGCICWNDSANAGDLTPLMPGFFVCPWMTLWAGPRGCRWLFVVAGSSEEHRLLWDDLQGKVLVISFQRWLQGGCGCSVTRKFWQPSGIYLCTDILCVHIYWFFIWDCLHGFTRMEEQR